MNTEEIKEQIDMQKLLIENHKICLSRTEKELALLESQLAEAEKPALRHGDYGLFNGNQPGIIHGIQMVKKVIWEHDGGEGLQERCGMKNFVALGNIFADLKARQEPLEQFRMCGLDVGLNEMGNIQLTNDDKDTLYIHSDDWHTFILNLQRLVYTAEQEAAK